QVDRDGGIGVRAGRVVDAQRRIQLGLAPRAARGMERDLAERNVDARAAGDVDLVRSGQRLSVGDLVAGSRLTACAHVTSLRRHYPHQVRGVSGALAGLSAVHRRLPAPTKWAPPCSHLEVYSQFSPGSALGHWLSERMVRMRSIHGGATLPSLR